MPSRAVYDKANSFFTIWRNVFFILSYRCMSKQKIAIEKITIWRKIGIFNLGKLGIPPFPILRKFTGKGAPVFWEGFHRDFPPPPRREGGVSPSVVIGGVAVFRPCFSVVAGLTEGLPVIFIPEKRLVTPMGRYMVHNGCRPQSASCKAAYTQRMCL